MAHCTYNVLTNCTATIKVTSVTDSSVKESNISRCQPNRRRGVARAAYSEERMILRSAQVERGRRSGGVQRSASARRRGRREGETVIDSAVTVAGRVLYGRPA